MEKYTGKATYISCSIFLSTLLLLIQQPSSSIATCTTCHNQLQDDMTSLNHRLSPRNFKMATFVPLTNIQPVLNYHNLTELYVKVLERFQSLTVLKQKMGNRIGEDVPPPHSHCFIAERSQHSSVETNSSRFSSRLREDLCMIVSLDQALNWTIEYERANHTNQFTNCIANVKYSVEMIVEGLANITNMTKDHCESEEQEEEGANSESHSDGGDNNEATTYRSRHLNHLPGRNNIMTNIQHGLEDPFAEQDVTPSFISSQMPTTETMPYARQSQRPNCGAISSDQQQFIYLYEVWVGMFYLQNDLLPMRDHHANN